MPEVDDGDHLTPLHRDVLEFEASSRSHAGAKASAIRARFGWSTAQYYQMLNELIDTEAALRHDALLVRRLQRIRDRREQR